MLSDFDLDALLAKLSLSEPKKKEEAKKEITNVHEKEDEAFGPPLPGLSGIRIKKPFLLFSYQLDVITWMKQREMEDIHGIRGALWVIEMGLGKTFMTLVLIISDLLSEQKKQVQVGPTLIVVPKSLLQNWKDEILKFLGPSVRVLAFFPDLMEPKSLFFDITFLQMSKYHIVLTTYETISRHVTPKKGTSGTTTGPRLLFLPWYRIVADESHTFANLKGKQFQALMQLRSVRKLALTGTPLRNYDSDMLAQMQFLGLKVSDAENSKKKKWWSAKVFHRLQLQRVVYTLTLEEAKIQLPEMHDVIVDCPLSEVEQRVYDDYLKINENLFEQYQNGSSRNMGQILTAMIRWRQICVSIDLLPKSDVDEKKIRGLQNNHSPFLSSKLRKVQEVLQKKIGPNEKVILFSNWTKALLLVSKMLDPKHTLFVDGKMKIKQRQAAFDRFKNDPSLYYLLITYRVGNVGLNFTMCQNIILLEPWYSGVLKFQAQKRIHRIGQAREVFIYNMLVPDSIEAKIVQICHKKNLLAQSYLDPMSSKCEEEEEEGQILSVLSAFFKNKGRNKT